MRKILLTVGALVVGACGGDDDKGYGDPITIDSSTKASLNAAVTSATSLRTIETNPGDDTALAKVTGLYSSLNLVISAKMAAQSQKPELAYILPVLEEAAQKPVAQACLTITSGKVVYAACSYGSGTINGSITYGNGTFAMDIKVTSTFGGSSISVTEKGSITVTSSSIEGDLGIDADVTLGSSHVTASFDADWGLVIADNCATGGDLEVHASGRASASGSSGSYDLWAKAVFGPTCGSITLY